MALLSLYPPLAQYLRAVHPAALVLLVLLAVLVALAVLAVLALLAALVALALLALPAVLVHLAAPVPLTTRVLLLVGQLLAAMLPVVATRMLSPLPL